MEEYFGVFPCTLMSMMSNNLLPSACETDMIGMVGMYVLQLAADTQRHCRLEQQLRRRSRQGSDLSLFEPAQALL